MFSLQMQIVPLTTEIAVSTNVWLLTKKQEFSRNAFAKKDLIKVFGGTIAMVI